MVLGRSGFAFVAGVVGPLRVFLSPALPIALCLHHSQSHQVHAPVPHRLGHFGCVRMEGLGRVYLRGTSRSSSVSALDAKGWWGKVSGFERKWTFALAALGAVSLAALFVFNSSKPRLIDYLSQNGFNDTRAIQIAGFSVVEASWFAALFLISAGVVISIMSGAWSGTQSKLPWILLGAVMIFDLARSDIPWIHYFNYEKEYAHNSVVDFLKDKPYEHRVSGRLAPKGLGSGMSSPIGRLYDYWQQNDFPYSGIQTLDFAQWPRTPLLDSTYMKNFALKGNDIADCDLWLSERLWQLTNTRYIIGSAALAPLLNANADGRHRVLIKTFLKIMPKADVPAIEDAGDMTAVPDGRGSYALMEFMDPLPRAKLYSHWESPTNDDATLKTLASRDFDPEETVLVAQNTPVNQPSGDPKTEPGTVNIEVYKPKYVKLEASATTPAILLLNDRIAPAWRVWIDQKAGCPAAVQLSDAGSILDTRGAYGRVSISTTVDDALPESLRLGSGNSNRGLCPVPRDHPLPRQRPCRRRFQPCRLRTRPRKRMGSASPRPQAVPKTSEDGNDGPR